MTSKTTAAFRLALAGLSPEVKKRARKAYLLFRENPQHPSLHFKRIHVSQPIFSARVSLGYRAPGVMSGEEIVWFWVGSHGEYDRLLRSFK